MLILFRDYDETTLSFLHLLANMTFLFICQTSLLMNAIGSEISQEHLAKYFHITETALAAASLRLTELQTDNGKVKTRISTQNAQQILNIAKQYTTDARHFEKKRDLVRAFAALNYAHGWLDCGAALGFISGKGSDLERWEK